MRPIVVGCDQSLTCTVLVSSEDEVTRIEPKQMHPIDRLSRIARLVHYELHGIAPGLFVLEGYAMGASFNREALGELGGVIKTTVRHLGWDILIVPPTTLKMYVSGKGNTEKDGMRMHVLNKWGYQSVDNNDADAYALRKLGEHYLSWQRGEETLKKDAELFAKTGKPKGKKQVAKPILAIITAAG